MADRDYVIRYDTQNVPTTVQQINSLKAAIDALDASANKSKKSLGDVGKATAAMARTDSKAKALAADLDAVTVAAGKAGTALQTVGGNIQRLPAATNTATTSLDKFAAQLAALITVQQAFSQTVDSIRQADQHYKDLAASAAKYRDTLREIAFIQGKPGPNNRVVADVIDLGLKSGMTPEQARGYAQSYENIGPTARGRNVFGQDGTPQAAKLERDVLAAAGTASLRMGVKGDAAGEAVGIMSSLGGFTNVENAMDLFGNAMQGLSEGKISDPTQGVRALNKMVAKLVDPASAEEAAGEGATLGRVANYGEAGIYMGALTLGTGTADQAQHRGVQISRALNPVDEAKRKVLEDAGVDMNATDPEKLIQLSAHLKTVKDPLSWLAQNGIGTEATREAIVAGSKMAGEIQRGLDKARAGGAGKKVLADNAQYMRVDRAAAANAAEAEKQALAIAQGAQFEDFETAKKYATNRATAAGMDPEMDWTGGVRSWISDKLFYGTQGTDRLGYTAENDPKFGAIPILKQQAKLAGIDVDKEYPVLNEWLSSPAERAEAFNKVAKRVRDAGGDPFGSSTINRQMTEAKIDALRQSDDAANGLNVKVDDAGMKDAANKMQDAADLMLKAAQANGGVPAGVGPGRPPGMNAGGAVRANR